MAARVRAVQHQMAPARPVGRPCKLTPDVQARICAVLAVGGTYKLAAIAGGVSQSGLRQWLERGRRVAEWAEQRDAAGDPADIAEDDLPYVELVQATDAAMLKPALVALQAIQAAAKDGDWRAGLAWLERRYPKDYGAQLTQKLEALGDGSERMLRVEFVNNWRGHDEAINDLLGDDFQDTPAVPAVPVVPPPDSPRIVPSTASAERRQDAPAVPQVAAESESLPQRIAALASSSAPVQRAPASPDAEAAEIRRRIAALEAEQRRQVG